MIIYFSATGNSKYVAEALADRLEDDVVRANELIKSGKKGDLHSDKPWVFVFPVYLSTIPEIFEDFIKSASFSGTKSAYFTATCASAMGSVPNYCERLCAEKGLDYMGAAAIKMPQNYIALFKMTEPNECERRYKAALDSADRISGVIKSGGRLEAKPASKVEYKATQLVEKLYNGHFTSAKKFRAESGCVGCGVCVKSCPLNNISLEVGRPVWGKSCVHCMACINLCPKGAVEYGKGTAGKRRYVCPAYNKK